MSQRTFSPEFDASRRTLPYVSAWERNISHVTPPFERLAQLAVAAAHHTSRRIHPINRGRYEERYPIVVEDKNTGMLALNPELRSIVGAGGHEVDARLARYASAALILACGASKLYHHEASVVSKDSMSARLTIPLDHVERCHEAALPFLEGAAPSAVAVRRNGNAWEVSVTQSAGDPVAQPDVRTIGTVAYVPKTASRSRLELERVTTGDFVDVHANVSPEFITGLGNACLVATQPSAYV